jgi:hypothetical protein
MPEGATDRIIFEGVRTTRRTRDMLLQARAIFYARTNKLPPRISQGGYNAGGVSASAGTHDRDALDFATSGWPAALQKEWEKAEWEVGFAAWWRRYIRGLWPEHNHAIPKGGDLSRGAYNQTVAFNRERDGLVSNRSYPNSGFAYQTWESYIASNKVAGGVVIDDITLPALDSISVYWINQKRESGESSRNVLVVQEWLQNLKLYDGPLDAKWSEDVQTSLDNFRRSLGWQGNDIIGPIGISSLQWLRLKNKSTRLIREGI